WQWEITEGPAKGQIIGRITSDSPTMRNSCGTLLSGLVGRPIRADEDIEPKDYVGHLYQVVVSPSKENPERTYVTQVIPMKTSNGTSGATTTPQPPPRSPSPPPPPPKPAAPPGTEGVPPPRYWVQDPATGKLELVTGDQVRDCI